MAEPSSPPTPKSPNHPSTIARNIIVGAITTIIGSTAVYFITRGKPNPHSDLEVLLMTKESTIEGWKSYVTFENAYAKKSLSLLSDFQTGTMNVEDFTAESQRESNKFKSGIEELITKKNIDKDFIQALKNRLDNENASMPILLKYMHFIKSIRDTNLTDAEKIKALQDESTKWAAQSTGMTDRAITDIEDIAKTLSERYGQTFAMTDFIVYNFVMRQRDSLNTIKTAKTGTDKTGVRVDTTASAKEVVPTSTLFVGKWEANSPNGADIDLAKTGKLFWHVLSNGDHISGTWKFIKDKLYMYPVNDETGKKATWIFELSNVRQNSFTMKLSVTPFNIYNMVRKAGQQ